MKRMPETRACLAAIVILLLSYPARGAVYASKAAVSSPERLSTAAGLNVLREGGTAADAAVAIAFTLTVLRPESAGVLGGGTAIYFDASAGEVWALDFRQELPNPTYVEGPSTEDAAPLAVPGFAGGFRELHQKFGSQPWEDLLRPAVALSGEADPALVRDSIEAARSEREIDQPEATLPARSILSRMAERGADDVYLGETSKQLVAASRSAGGTITPRALAEYSPRWRSPMRLDFRGDRVYTMPEPAGAGGVLVETLTLLSGFDWDGKAADDAGTIHLFVEAERYGWSVAASAYSDRDAVSRRMALSSDDLAKTRKKIESAPLDARADVAERRHESLGFVVIDEDGNAAVVTLSMGPPFGSGKLVSGEAFIAEARSEEPADPSLPLLILKDDRVRLVMNASGRGRDAAIGGTLYIRAKVFDSDLEDLISMSRLLPATEPRTIRCERGADLKMIDALNAMGHGVEWTDELGTVHAIEVGERIAVISDPRGGTAGGY